MLGYTSVKLQSNTPGEVWRHVGESLSDKTNYTSSTIAGKDSTISVGII